MEIYHVLSRGVDKRKIFMDEQDYFRFIHDLYEFNNQDRVNSTTHEFRKSNDLAGREVKKRRKLIVEIHAFCLMPNHYHLLLSSRVPNGISKFMAKQNMGYAKYFNQKYQRTGALFGSRYKSILIREESHFIHIPYYIHLNPLDLVTPEWRERKMSDYRKAISFLKNYRWSSFQDYLGIKNFPSVTNRRFLGGYLGGVDNYKRETLAWIKGMKMSEISSITLE